MRYGNITKDLSTAIDDAIVRFKVKYPDELAIEMWLQTWGSTALGFGGIGGQAITSAYTFLVWGDYKEKCLVYFAGRFAYEVTNINDAFRKAYSERRMPAVYEVKKLGMV